LSIWSFAWSPNSKQIVFQGTDTPLTDDSYMFKKIYQISIEEGIPSLLCKTEGKLGPMAFSPDGNHLAYLGAVSLNDPLAQSLFVVPSSGGTPKNLTENFEGSGHNLYWLDNHTVLLLSTEGVQNTLRKVDIRTGKMKLIYSNGPIITSLSLHRKSGKFAAIANAPTHPSELFVGTVKKGHLTRLTHTNPELREIKLARQEVIEWEGADGWKIQGILTYPLHYQEGKKYPLALQIHGGPEGVSVNGWRTRATYPVQILAANDYFVLEPNYRGSGGRGVAFSKADHDDLGGKEFEDVLAGIDHLVKMGYVDNEQVVTGGWSYGGYFSAWAATRHSQRFKAAVVAAGLTNWISFAGTTDIPHEMSLVHWNSYWLEQRDLHWERSPLYHIQNANTPTLIVHGLKDERVHPEQSLELYQALKLKGVPTRLIMYPREPHGLREVPHMVHFINSVISWFEEHVKKKAEPHMNKYIN
ncbi:MAG: S9 family peptidase, partial [Calditrichaeota bacterium]